MKHADILKAQHTWLWERIASDERKILEWWRNTCRIYAQSLAKATDKTITGLGERGTIGGLGENNTNRSSMYNNYDQARQDFIDTELKPLVE